MLNRIPKLAVYAGTCLLCAQGTVLVHAAPKSQVEIALQYKPLQEGVEYSIPSEEDVPNCKARKINGGLRIVDGNNMTLREIFDTDSDKVPDQWRYFQNGLEVYRESDTNADKKKDQFHWFNTAGTRMGVDTNGDGKINEWKALSAQELTAEVALALANGDASRFEAVLLTPEELKELGLGDEKYELIKNKLQKTRDNFAASLESKPLSPSAKWMQFNGTPSAYPAGTDGSEKDVEFYENTSVVVHDGEKDVQLAVGTIIRVGKVWKVIDAPVLTTTENINDIAANNVFITFPTNAPNATGEGTAQSSDELNKLDEQINTAQTVDEMTALHVKRADLLEEMAKNAAGAEEREQWIHTLVDGVISAVQQGVYPEGLQRMEKLLATLTDNDEDKPLASYVKFRLMSSEYSQAMMKSSGTGWLQVRTKWLEDLTSFIEAYPDSPDTAEAMLQLAMENENDGEVEKAVELYSTIISKFADSGSAAKAQGAKTRLECVGKPLSFTALVMGQEGKQINLANLKGRVVILHFWASWMGDPVREMDNLKAIVAKYPKEAYVLGVNLDDEEETAKQFVSANHMSWYQMFEKGGMESRPATALGIFNVPTVFVIGADGNVISNNVMSSELPQIVANAVKAVKPVAPAEKK